MSATFDAYVAKLGGLFEQLVNSTKLPLSEVNNLPSAPGCYALSEDDNYLYVGIGKNVRRRIKNHLSGRAEQSAFAFKLARIKFGAPVTYRKDGGRADLMSRPEFIQEVKQTIERVRNMSVQVVTIEDLSLLYLFEFFAAKSLNTPYNDFNTH